MTPMFARFLNLSVILGSLYPASCKAISIQGDLSTAEEVSEASSCGLHDDPPSVSSVVSASSSTQGHALLQMMSRVGKASSRTTGSAGSTISDDDDDSEENNTNSVVTPQNQTFSASIQEEMHEVAEPNTLSKIIAYFSSFTARGDAFLMLLVCIKLCAARYCILMQQPSSYKAVAPYIAEFVGTYVLVFTIGCAVISGGSSWGTFGVAGVLMTMIYSTGAVSGGHLNPAVSLALFVAGQTDMTCGKMLRYWVVQVIAGICASLSYCVLLFPQAAHVAPAPGFTCWQAGIVEMIYTCTLAFVVLNVATVEEKLGNFYYALSIAFVVLAGGYAAGNISGGIFNPAVSIGLSISSQSSGYGFLWVLFQLLGGTLAGLSFKVVRRRDANGKPTLVAKFSSEFVGTYVLVFTVGLNIITNNEGPTPLSAAAALMAMIYALGDVSGAHFNPAVTLACYLRGATPPWTAWIYVAVQAAAGLCGGCLCVPFHINSAEGVPKLAPGTGHNPLVAGLVELAFTTVLAYSVLSTATCNKSNHHYGLTIGFSVLGAGFSAGHISGGVLNPAVATGITSASYFLGGSPTVIMLILYSLSECGGGILADLLFRVTHVAEFEEEEK